MAKIWVALIWSITINGQSQFTARSDTNNTNILKSYPIYTRNKFRRDVWSHQKREKGTTPQARCDSWGDSSYMESPEEQHLAWVNVLFWVTSHVSPELLSHATGLKFLLSELAGVYWPEESTIYGPGPVLWPLKLWSKFYNKWPKKVYSRKLWH